MSELSEYLNARIPRGWSKTDVIEAFGGRVDRTTVYRYLSGRHPRRPSEAVLEAFVAVLPGTSIVELRRAAGQPLGAAEPWILPPEANRLNAAQRRAIEAFIRATVSAEDSSLAEEQQAAPLEVAPAARNQLEDYIEQLYASGRTDLADRLAATLATNSGSDAASRTNSSTVSKINSSETASKTAGD